MSNNLNKIAFSLKRPCELFAERHLETRAILLEQKYQPIFVQDKNFATKRFEEIKGLPSHKHSPSSSILQNSHICFNHLHLTAMTIFFNI